MDTKEKAIVVAMIIGWIASYFLGAFFLYAFINFDTMKMLGWISPDLHISYWQSFLIVVIWKCLCANTTPVKKEKSK